MAWHMTVPSSPPEPIPAASGTQWVKKYWVVKDYPAEFEGIDKRASSSTSPSVRPRQILASDNPYLLANYHDRSLLTLPPDMAKRVAQGDWDVYTGQYFPHFDQKIHVIPHAEALARIQPWWQRALSGDWGDIHPHCFHWHAKDERNCVITHDELWDRGVTETEAGRRITECEAKYHKLARLNGFVFSWDAGRLSRNALREQPKSQVQMLSDALGPNVPKPFPADSSPGVRLIRSRLMSLLLQSRTWLISDRCAKLIEAIPTMIRDEPDHPEEMRKIDWNEAQIGDDPIDSAGMGLQWMIGSTVKPDAVKREEAFQAVREQFVARAQPQPRQPGVDWFQRFGGHGAKGKR